MKIITLFVLLCCFSNNILAEEETPKEGVQAIIALYQARDFITLIHERYSEIYKAESVGKVDYLIQRHTKRFANKKLLEEVISYYQSALAAKSKVITNPNPQVTETDKMVVFDIKDAPLQLYLQKSNKWGFHM